MKTELIYFDKTENSNIGTLKGIIAGVILVVINLTLYKTYSKVLNLNLIALFFLLFFLASAISVQKSDKLKETLVYSLLLGFVVFGIINALFVMIKNINWTMKDIFLSIFVGVLSVVFSSYILFELRLKFI